MRISDVAHRADVNVQTLRYYERRGLVAAPPRSPSGYRAYPADAVEVVRFIKRAQQLGFSLSEVEELLQLADGGPASCDAARHRAEAQLADLAAKVADLQRMQESLYQLIATCSRPRHDRKCPLLKAIGTATSVDDDTRPSAAQVGRGPTESTASAEVILTRNLQCHQ